jgi:hypothetical protein
LRSRPADLSPGESGAVEPWRPAPLLVYAADRKQICPAHGAILRGVDGATMREIGEWEVRGDARAETRLLPHGYHERWPWLVCRERQPHKALPT